MRLVATKPCWQNMLAGNLPHFRILGLRTRSLRSFGHSVIRSPGTSFSMFHVYVRVLASTLVSIQRIENKKDCQCVVCWPRLISLPLSIYIYLFLYLCISISFSLSLWIIMAPYGSLWPPYGPYGSLPTSLHINPYIGHAGGPGT